MAKQTEFDVYKYSVPHFRTSYCGDSRRRAMERSIYQAVSAPFYQNPGSETVNVHASRNVLTKGVAASSQQDFRRYVQSLVNQCS